VPDLPRICVVSASGQNVFFAEILEAFAEALREQGATVEESVDCFPVPAPDLVYLFIPHEYNPMVEELAHPNPVQLRRSIALNTEQPGTNWFEIVADVAAGAGAVVDINALGAKELKRRGVDAEHAPLGYVAAWDAWGGRENSERSIDVAFLGGHTDRRARVLARAASTLGGLRTALHLTETMRPHVVGSPYFLAGEHRSRLLADSKVLLNIHQQELPYMEWHRLLGAVLNGCVVLSEHSLRIAPFEPGVHFASASYDDLPHVVEGLLSDPERLAMIRKAAYDLVREEMPMATSAEVVLGAAVRVREAEMSPSSLTPPPSVPLPKSLPERKPEWEARSEWLGEQLPARRALKHLVTQTRELARHVEALVSQDEPAEDLVEQLGPELPEPQVSVLLSVHNYADLVGEALRSVALGDLREVEVVAVDDASTDGSVEAVRVACAELPWLSVKHVRRGRNHGLPAARNLAIEHARADLLFVLDADNLVLPQGLDRLAQALDENPQVAFAYGILETFDANGSLGLKSWLDWDPGRLRYGNYVDAMSVIRRSALEEVGGFPTEQALAGWEDFALWVAMADAGLSGIRLPEFIGRYRLSPHSMVALTDIDHSEAWATLLRKYPVLTQGSSAQAV
jgi:Glycosyl transferase family 2